MNSSLFLLNQLNHTEGRSWNLFTQVIRVHLTTKKEEGLVSVKNEVQVPEHLCLCTCPDSIALGFLWNSFFLLYDLFLSRWWLIKKLITYTHEYQSSALWQYILIYYTYLIYLLIFILIKGRLSKNSVTNLVTLALQKGQYWLPLSLIMKFTS